VGSLDGLLEAALPLLHPAFELWGSPVSWLEIFAFVASIGMVVLNMRVRPAAWPLAIVASAAYALLFAHSRLYGEAGLQLIFIAVACWGWWQWQRGTDAAGAQLKVGRLATSQRLTAAAATLAAWPALGALLDVATDSDLPYFDALPTVASITGQLLLGRKKIETWAVWLGVNVVSIGLFAAKALWLTALLYAVFALLSVAGWRAWQRIEGQADA
jgi:nicotinamide mononucleotide transporter